MNEAAPPTYVARARILEDEAVWRLTPDALELQGGPVDLQNGPAAGPDGIVRFPYRDIVEVRLYYAPTQYNTVGYGCALRMRRRMHIDADLEIQSTHHTGFGFSEDRTATYVAFVRALIARVVVANPAARFRAGLHPFRYWFANTLLLGLVPVLVFVISERFGDSLWLKVAIFLVFIPILIAHAIGWGRKNWPRSFNPSDIPQDVLP
ncbi:MAG: hypothetical protein K2Y71_01955 [Xanthobacteraceae bacterium]|nr:hypothetical protein [Xanthobacteraceae bacterium]